MNELAGTYLERIVADVRARLDTGSEPALPEPSVTRARRSLVELIHARRAQDQLAIIGEVKRRSPSVGVIVDEIDPAAQAARYTGAGAAGISVLTEPDHFGGSLDDLVSVRASVDVAVLRKDFLIDPRQLHDARVAGADVVLLIAAILDDAQLAAMTELAHELQLEVLLEVHDEHELERALESSADVIGINNRDLRSFVVDLAVTERLVPLTAGDPRPIVAESGVRTPADAARMRICGVDALLVGEALMRAQQPGELLRQLATATDLHGAHT